MSVSKPGFRIINQDSGSDITKNFQPRLISLSLTEERGEAADRVEVILDDADGLMDVPAEGVTFELHLGWDVLEGRASQLLDKGSFKVDEASASGPPDIITITARSADLTGGFRIRKDRAHEATTVGAIATKVAKEHGLTAQVHADAASIEASLEAQQGASNMALLRTIGQKHDLSVTQKKGKLIVAPVGMGETATGKALPAATIERKDTDTYRYARAKREQHDGVEAQWHDRKTATVKTIREGHEGKGEPRKLKRTHPTEAAAKAHARSSHMREKRTAATCEVTLALGRPEISVEQAATLKGWKPVIDGTNWLVKTASHTLDSSGLKTTLSLETKA